MSIKSLYREYFQKSRIFLYPALEIKRGSSVTPIETYISCNDIISPKDRKLICLYHLRDDKEYKTFEEQKLFNNKLFDDFKEAGDNQGLYIFNFNEYNKDWDNFLKGRYSKISPELKRKIKEFFRTNTSNSIYVDSYVNPDKYYDLYAELLGVNKEVLKKVGELCSGPDLEKESLTISIKQLNNKLKNKTLL